MPLPSVALDPTPWNLLLLAAVALAFAVGAIAVRRGRRSVNLVLAVLMVAGGLWSLSAVLQGSAPDAGSADFWAKLQYLWIPMTAVTWLVFGLEYGEYGEYVTPTTVGVLALHPVGVAVAAFTNPAHHAFWVGSPGSATGPVWIAHAVVSYVELLAGTGLVLSHLYRDEETYRMQAVALGVGVLVPMGLNATFLVSSLVLGASFFPGDPTPVGFAVTGAVFLYGMRSYGLADVTPVAKSVVVDNLNDGLIIVDDDGRITEINDHARGMLGLWNATVGDDLADALAHAPELVELGGADESLRVELDVEVPTGPDVAADGGTGDRRTFDVEVTPVRGQHDDVIGRLFQFRDVTDRVERERELELQNRQLDNFVAAISREIRDPMEELDEQLDWAVENAPETEQRLRRVLYASNGTVDDVATTLDELVELAREESVVREEDMAPVSLADAADHAWWEATGREGAATLSVANDVDLYADRDRLQRILENCFDNAVVHGGDDVRVTVGTTTDDAGNPTGFYVADDGPGIGDVEDPFAPGVTTTDDRPGIGLAVVSTGAEAHGWSVAATTGTDGGARIEITDVDFPDVSLSERVESFAGTGLSPGDDATAD